MRILLDQNAPRALRRLLAGHEVRTAREMGWDAITNGALLGVAAPRFDLLITADQKIRYEQNLTRQTLAILVLPTNRWPEVRLHIDELAAAVSSMKPGEYRELVW